MLARIVKLEFPCETRKVGVQSETITLEKQFWQFSIKLNAYLAKDPAISLLFTAGKWKQGSKKQKLVQEYSQKPYSC